MVTFLVRGMDFFLGGGKRDDYFFGKRDGDGYFFEEDRGRETGLSPTMEREKIKSKVVVVAAVREGALQRRSQQRHKMKDRKDREGVVEAADFHRRLYLSPDLFHDLGLAPSPFRVNSAFPASLYCSSFSRGTLNDSAGNRFQHLRLGSLQLGRPGP